VPAISLDDATLEHDAAFCARINDAVLSGLEVPSSRLDDDDFADEAVSGIRGAGAAPAPAVGAAE